MVTATVAQHIRTAPGIEEKRLDVTGAPPIKFTRTTVYPTGLHITYDGSRTKTLRILTPTGNYRVRLDLLPQDPVAAWVIPLVDQHRPTSHEAPAADDRA